MKLTDLKKGDVFKFGPKDWDSEHRFHSLQIKEDGRYTIFLMGLMYNGIVEKANWNSFTWRDEDEEIFIPVYYLSEQRRTKGMPCVPVSNERHILPSNLNEINLSDIYCSHDKYWYQRVCII